MSKRCCWRIATIAVVVLIVCALKSEYAYLAIIGGVLALLTMGPPAGIWVKVVGFVADVLYSMFGRKTKNE